MQLKKGMAIHCKTKEEAKEFIKIAYEQGFKWISKNDSVNTTYYSEYEKDIVYVLGYYYIKDITYSLIENYIDKDNIIEFSDLKKKENKSMTKSDLENGMIVELRDGNKYLIHDNLLLTKDGYIRLNNYNEDLTLENRNQNRFDIIRIYESVPYSLMGIFKDEYLSLIWKREECKRINFSDDALEILKRIPKELKWLAKDDNNDTPWVYRNKPNKDVDGEWVSEKDAYTLKLFEKYFENVTSNDLIYINDYVERS